MQKKKKKDGNDNNGIQDRAKNGNNRRRPEENKYDLVQGCSPFVHRIIRNIITIKAVV